MHENPQLVFASRIDGVKVSDRSVLKAGYVGSRFSVKDGIKDGIKRKGQASILRGH